MKYFLLFIIYLTAAFFVNGQFTEEAIAVKTNNDSLRGESVVPDGATSFPLVIIVAGSGPADRNGNSPAG